MRLRECRLSDGLMVEVGVIREGGVASMSERESDRNGEALSAARINSDHVYHYYKLQTHRCWVLEGIRAIAYRSMDFSVKHGLALDAKGLPAEEYSLELQNEMLKAQGLELNSTDGAFFLESALWTPWEVYTCLLHAELEYYERIAKKNPELAYEPLERCFKLHSALIQSLGDVRDSFLHPLREPNYQTSFLAFAELAASVGDDFRVVLRSLQMIMDDYLHWLQAGLMQSLFDEMKNFSTDQLLQFADTTIDAMRKTLAVEESGMAGKEIRRGIEEGMAHKDSLLSYREVDYPPDAIRQWQYIRWKGKLALLGEPLPERPYYVNPAPIWVPRPEDVMKPTDDPATPRPGPTGELLANASANRKNWECIALVMRSIMLLNLREPCPFDLNQLGDISQSVQLLETVEDYRRACRSTSPFMVSLALLVEPLRLYLEATIANPELKRQDIEEQLGGDFYQMLLRFRNTIFHVPDERTNYHKAAVALFESLRPGGNREIIFGLQDFYMNSLYDGGS